MTDEQNKKLIGSNAVILTAAALASFVLPMIVESMTEGRGNFIKAMAQMIPLFAVIPLSCRLVAMAGAPSKSSP